MDVLAPPVAPVRRPRVTLVLLRAVVTIFLVAVLGQPVFAGLFLTGDVDAIVVHGLVGSLLVAVAMVVGVVSVCYVVAGGRWWALVGVPLFLLIGIQVGMGYARVLGVHVPLGVAIVTLSVLFTVAVWHPAAGRGRAR